MYCILTSNLGENDTCLNIRKTERFQLLQLHPGDWLEAKLGDRTGFVPNAYIELIPISPPQPRTAGCGGKLPAAVSLLMQRMPLQAAVVPQSTSQPTLLHPTTITSQPQSQPQLMTAQKHPLPPPNSSIQPSLSPSLQSVQQPQSPQASVLPSQVTQTERPAQNVTSTQLEPAAQPVSQSTQPAQAVQPVQNDVSAQQTQTTQNDIPLQAASSVSQPVQYPLQSLQVIALPIYL